MSMTPQDFDALMARRYSCRGFRPDPVPRDVIEGIVASARRTPSWCNAQPWQVAITSGAETEAFRVALKAELEAGGQQPDIPFPARYSGIYQDRRRTCGWALYEAVGVTKGDREGSARQMMQNFDLFGAPHCAIISSPEDLGPYGALDCGGFVTAFTLAATAAGVATIPQAALAGYSPFLRRYFDIPDDRLVLCGISFGYEDPDHPANGFRTERASVADVVDWRG